MIILSNEVKFMKESGSKVKENFQKNKSNQIRKATKQGKRRKNLYEQNQSMRAPWLKNMDHIQCILMTNNLIKE